jgi:hypothetical protein
MASVAAAMPAVQQQVEQWAQQHQQKRQHTEDVSRVFGDEEKCGNGQEGDEHEAGSRPKPALGL